MQDCMCVTLTVLGKSGLISYSEMFHKYGPCRPPSKLGCTYSKCLPLWSLMIETTGWNLAGLPTCHWGHFSQSSRSSVNIKRTLMGWGRDFKCQGCSSATQMAIYQLAMKSYPTTGFKDSQYLQTEAPECLFVITSMQLCSQDTDWEQLYSTLIEVIDEGKTWSTFFKTFMANILPDAAPTTFRTWKTCTGGKMINMFKITISTLERIRRKITQSVCLYECVHVKYTFSRRAASWVPQVPFHNHLSPGPAAARSTPAWCSPSPGWRCPPISQSSHSRPCCCRETLNSLCSRSFSTN